MKKLLLLIGLSSCLLTVVLAQTGQNHYLQVNYLYVSPDQMSQFSDMRESQWKPANQSLVQNSGGLNGWYLYTVKYPGGEKSHYNFISILSADSLNVFESPDEGKVSPSEMQTRHKPVATLIASELWKVENEIPLENGNQPDRYMSMDYMRVTPGKELDYLMLENELAKPIHAERMKLNKMQGWEVYSLIKPGGTEYGYNYATGNFFNHLGNIEFGFTEEVIKNALPRTNIPELFNTIFSTRKLVKSELWELVDYTK